MAYEVIRQTLTAEARLRPTSYLGETKCHWNEFFSQHSGFPPVSIVPLSFSSNAALIRTNWRSPGIFAQNSAVSVIERHCTRNYPDVAVPEFTMVVYSIRVLLADVSKERTFLNFKDQGVLNH
jgi:hypothetical protein